MAKEPSGGRTSPPSKPAAKAPARKRVRYGPKVVQAICVRLAAGKAWSDVCTGRGMPSYSSLFAWQRRYPEFAEAVAIARQMGAESKADRAVAVAEDATSETLPKDRLRVSALLKHASLTAPRPKIQATGAAKGGGKMVLEVRVRRFEKVIGADGRPYVREIRPEGEAPRKARGAAKAEGRR